MRRLPIVLSLVMLALALTAAPAAARGPQKNDSVSGHGLVLFAPGTTYQFRVSAHTLSSSTSLATGNMFIEAVQEAATGTLKVKIWADVFCLSVLATNAEVRGHIYRTEPDLLTAPTDLVFNVTDTNSLTTLPDLFSATTEAAPTICVEPPPPGTSEVAKGDISVNDESPL